jgi:hypothetical protein
MPETRSALIAGPRKVYSRELEGPRRSSGLDASQIKVTRFGEISVANLNGATALRAKVGQIWLQHGWPCLRENVYIGNEDEVEQEGLGGSDAERNRLACELASCAFHSGG